jgi:RecB family exonuclease
MADGILEPAHLPVEAPPLSPSAFESLLTCGLRYAWEEAREPGRLPGFPSARLGSVVHDLFMRAGRGDIEPQEPAVKEAWRAALDRIEGGMRCSWLERPFVPLRSRVRHYEETRQAAVRQAIVLAHRAPALRKGAASGEGSLEARLTSSDGRVSGRLDVALWTPAGVVIRDYKTGSVYEEVEEGKPAVKVAYQYQLKLYAALHADARGAWPVRIELMTVTGDIVDIPFRPDECEALFEEAKTAATVLWSRVADVRTGRRQIDTLASPGDGCKWCRYRPVCPAYRPWSEVQSGDASRRVDVWGEVRTLGTSRRGLAVLELDTDKGKTQVLDLDPSSNRNPALAQMVEGDRVAVFDASPMSDRSLRAADQTVVYLHREVC